MLGSPNASEFRWLKPLCLVLRWVCLGTAALTVTGVIAMVAVPTLFFSSNDDHRWGVGDVTPSETPTKSSIQLELDVKEAPAGEKPKPGFRITKEVAPGGSNEPIRMSLGASVLMVIGLGAPLIAQVWGLWNGSLLFKRLGAGLYFARTTVTALRNFAVGMLVYKLLPMATLPMAAAFAGGAVQAKAAPRTFSYTFNPFEMDGALMILFLGMIAIFAHIMTKAAELAEDNAQIV